MTGLPENLNSPIPVDEASPSPLGGAPWGLVSYSTDGADRPHRAGVLDPTGRILHLEAGDHGMRDLLSDWDSVGPHLEAIDLDTLDEVDGATVELVIGDPSKIVCAAANYHSHVTEMGGESPPAGVAPYFFLKPPSTTLIGDRDAVDIGAWDGAQVDWEAELAVVVGRRVSRVDRTDAMSVVAGFTVMNDITDRAGLFRAPAAGPAFTFDWFSAKSRDHSCPLGSVIVPSFLVADPAALSIRLWVNDVLKQDSTTADMIDDVPTLIAAASEVMTLEPGDLIATGTPAGVGPLAAGDVVDVRIEGIGVLRNPVHAAIR